MRITDAQFSALEAGLIRRVLETAGATLRCPRCASDLMDDESIGVAGAESLRCRLIRCAMCRRMMAVTG